MWRYVSREEDQMRKSETNQLLGYPEDARLLLVNADDLGMYQAINEGVVRAIQDGIVQSTSLMVPCPGAARAMQLLKENLDISFGGHLSIICDIDHYLWHPLVAKERVPSLLDENGNFYSIERMSDMLALAKVDELETEFRAQIEAVLTSGLKPDHLDWHCLHSGGRADIFYMTMELAKEYGLAVRIGSQPFIEQVQKQGLPTNDYDLLDSFDLNLTDKSARYIQMLRDLPVGLSEWAVHPSTGSDESQSIDPGGWQVRRTDFDFVISPEAREVIQEEGIILIDYKLLQKVWQDKLS
jgi:predicted glycoside hydrolase/deacetylase ChbG (UPF0249 family)